MRPPRSHSNRAGRGRGAGRAVCGWVTRVPLLPQDGGRPLGLVPSIGFAAGLLEVTAARGGARRQREGREVREGSAAGTRGEAAGPARRPGGLRRLRQDGGSREAGAGGGMSSGSPALLYGHGLPHWLGAGHVQPSAPLPGRSIPSVP